MLQAFFFVHAVKIPRSAPTTIALTTPFHNGRYTATVTVKVGGKTLKAFGAININCVT